MNLFEFLFLVSVIVENITCTADELGTLGSQFHSAPVDKVSNRNETKWSFKGNSSLKNRFAALERRVTNVSNELDAFKASVMQTFDTFNVQLEKIRREIRNNTQSRTVIIFCYLFYCLI